MSRKHALQFCRHRLACTPQRVGGGQWPRSAPQALVRLPAVPTRQLISAQIVCHESRLQNSRVATQLSVRRERRVVGATTAWDAWIPRFDTARWEHGWVTGACRAPSIAWAGAGRVAYVTRRRSWSAVSASTPNMQWHITFEALRTLHSTAQLSCPAPVAPAIDPPGAPASAPAGHRRCRSAACQPRCSPRGPPSTRTPDPQ